MPDHRDVGVVVGRFQVPELHDAHRNLIQRVCDSHGKVLIFLGVSPLWSTKQNPLDFEARKQMILAAFPQVSVLYVKDVNDDALWSKRLDAMISDVVTPAQSVLLYGGRDSFVSRYSGRYPTTELEQDTWVSGSVIRDQVRRSSVKATADFRAGVVWGAFCRYPTCYPTVDVAILNESQTKILLGRKPYEKKFRLIGGFAEPDSVSYEQDARREVAAEVGVEITDPEYIGSFKVDDWRYRGETDKIKTLLFLARYMHGVVR